MVRERNARKDHVPVNEHDLFIAALKIEDPAGRSAYLDQACGVDAELRQRVDALLKALAAAGSFLQQPAADAAATADSSPAGASLSHAPTEGPGTVIGPYKLLQQIGEGGMGTVFMAEQTQPVQRKVALKLIKAGMDSRQVIARFEAERQALAMMDHVNIARVLDAGTIGSEPRPSGSGAAEPLPYGRGSERPYFVMELVHGVPITKYCDDNHLTPRQRLELFVPVCQAIQHAHQKGIIHRDIKPSNVMVTLYDGKPVPKVIDFGVAKATEQKLTERTLFTQYGTMVGTLEYMSPEQAEMSALGVDTRSDIFSLGVLLYELLTGSTPLTHKRMKEAAYGEILRLIKEEEPPKPSTRLSDSGEALASISAQRHMEPAKLAKLVRGELDWIVMKTLEKDRNRRYETANGLAMDVQRYLADEAVQACPPSVWYRFRKFARRNKVGLAVVGLILFFIVLLGGGGGWVMRDRAAREEKVLRDRAGRRTVLEQAVLRALEETETASRRDRLPETAAALKRAEELLASGECSEELGARVRQWRTDLDLVDRLEAIRLRRATLVDGKFDSRTADRDYAATFGEAGLGVVGEEADAAAGRVRASAVSAQLVAALDDWATVTNDPRRRAWLLAVARHADPDPWRDRFRDLKVWGDRAALAALASELLRDEAQLGKQKPQLLAALGAALQSTKADLAPLLAAAQARHPDDFWLNLQLGSALRVAKQWNEAVGYCRVAVALRPNSTAAHNNLGNALYGKRQLDEAIREYRTAIELEHKGAAAHYNLGNALRDKKQLDEAIRELRTAIDLDPEYFQAHNNIGNALYVKKQLDEAIREFRTAIDLDPTNALSHNNLGNALREKKQLDEAIREYRTAIELDPKFVAAHYNLGNALRDKKQLDEAICELRTAIKLDPKYALAHSSLGVALCHKKQLEEAIREYRTAIDLDPKDAAAHSNLGNALRDKKQLDEAVREYRTAIDLDPKSAPAHSSLGYALYVKKQLHDAIREYRTAIDLDPKDAAAHSALGSVLRSNKQLDEAIRAFRTAIDLDPKYAKAHNNLGAVLYEKKQLDEAIRAFRTAIDLDPKYANAHGGLGHALHDKKQLDEAIREFRTAIDLQSDFAEAHCGLGQALEHQGKFAQALTEWRRGHELGSQRPGWPYPSAARVRQAEGLVQLEGKLVAILQGKDNPAKDSERVQLAWLCQQPFKMLYAASARFYAEAFDHDAKLADDVQRGHRYSAACAAALAGCGQGNDAGKLDDKDRVRLRQQALTWLRADLAYWSKQADSEKPDERARVARTLTHWQDDTDLAGLREQDAVAKVTADEQAACRKVWADVKALLKKAQEKPK
jgi:tetratricopeptide (TPR) repeat protein/serine/threonine protein kinase